MRLRVAVPFATAVTGLSASTGMENLVQVLRELSDSADLGRVHVHDWVSLHAVELRLKRSLTYDNVLQYACAAFRRSEGCRLYVLPTDIGGATRWRDREQVTADNFATWAKEWQTVGSGHVWLTENDERPTTRTSARAPGDYAPASGFFQGSDGAGSADGSSSVRSSVRSSSEEPKFRRRLLKLYGARCVICNGTWLDDSASQPVHAAADLEAAHIVPLAVDSDDSTLEGVELSTVWESRNGVMLCKDCHLFFDQLLVHVDPESETVIVEDGLLHDDKEGAWWAARSGATVWQPTESAFLRPSSRIWKYQADRCLAYRETRRRHAEAAGKPYVCDV